MIAQLINIQEMYRMYKGMEPTSIFRDHMYRFIPLHFRREVRVLSCVIMLNIYSLFIFGVVKVSNRVLAVKDFETLLRYIYV